MVRLFNKLISFYEWWAGYTPDERAFSQFRRKLERIEQLKLEIMARNPVGLMVRVSEQDYQRWRQRNGTHTETA